MDFAEYRSHDATGLAQLVMHGAVSPSELLDVAWQRHLDTHPTINALCAELVEFGRERAALDPAGRFAGVPFLLKDIAQDLAGVPTGAGSRAFRRNVPTTNSSVVDRFLASGLVVFGKTNLPELALTAVTEPTANGATRNPWDPTRTPGGSSGGAAAAIAAGVVPMAGASDGGGSIRIPAGYCGLFGLRPGRGVVPAGPARGEFWHGASSEHVITRSVRDSAAMLDVLAGPDTGAPFHVAAPADSYLAAMDRPRTLRVGYSTDSPIGGDVHPEAVAVVEDAARLLESLGHVVEPAAPAVDGTELARCYVTMYAGQVAADVAFATAELGARESDFELETRVLALVGRTIPAGEYVTSRRRWNDFARALGAFHQQYDLHLTPAAAQPPSLIGEQDLSAGLRIASSAVVALHAGRVLVASGVLDDIAHDALERVPFTQLSNLTFTPSMSVPLHWTADGLPMGAHFIGPVGSEPTLLALARQLEEARPWFGRVPMRD